MNTTSSPKNITDKDFDSDKDFDFELDFSLCHSNCYFYSC
jgi:hypothetical protein